MPGTYTEYKITTADTTTAEIIMALLAEHAFDTFEIKDNQLFAYISTDLIQKNDIESVIEELSEKFSLSISSGLYDDRNWNEEWEKNFEPVNVEGKVHIRAPFHPVAMNMEYEIIIEPRMSFGTGHHESTHLMIAQMLETDLTAKKVFDAGCGTGILSIFAIKRKAAHVLAADNNEWAYANSLDNAALNSIPQGAIRFVLGDLDIYIGKTCDILLANINKPIIIENIMLFRNCLHPAGILLVSGILIQDMPDIITAAEACGFQLRRTMTRNDWALAEFIVPDVENF